MIKGKKSPIKTQSTDRYYAPFLPLLYNELNKLNSHQSIWSILRIVDIIRIYNIIIQYTLYFLTDYLKVTKLTDWKSAESFSFSLFNLFSKDIEFVRIPDKKNEATIFGV